MASAPGIYTWTGGAWRSNAGEPPEPEAWTPAALQFLPSRPTGSGYVAIESLAGVAAGDLRAAAVHPDAHGKVITLPNGLYQLNDFAQGDGNKFMWGLMVNPSLSTYRCRGFFGSGAGTVIQMVPNSSRFTQENGTVAAGDGVTQFQQNIFGFYNVDNVEIANLVVQGVEMQHWHHAVRVNGNNAYIHHVRMYGAAYGNHCVPPGETYSFAATGTGLRIEDCEFDGRRSVGGPVVSSTVLATLNATNPELKRLWIHDLKSGFGCVQWQGTGFYSEDMWVARPGSGVSGFNGCHTNHENGRGPVRHVRPHIELDAYYGPTDVPGKTRRTQGKFGHFILLRPSPADGYADMRIEDPVYDSWGGIAGGFCILLDETAITQTAKPIVVKNGVEMTGVIRPKWWEDKPTPFNPATQYWIGANSGDGSLWG